MSLLLIKNIYEGDKVSFVMGGIIFLIIIAITLVNITYGYGCDNYNNNPNYDLTYNQSKIENPPLDNWVYYEAAQRYPQRGVKYYEIFNIVSYKIKAGFRGIFVIGLILSGFFLFYIGVGYTIKEINLRVSLFKNFGIVDFKDSTKINL